MVRRVLSERGGGAAVVMAVAAPALVIMTSAALSFAEAYAVRSELQNTMDGAVLAGAALPSSASASERIEAANNLFAANELLGERISRCNLDVDVKQGAAGGSFRANGVNVTGDAEVCLSGGMLGALGRDQLRISVTAEATKAWSAPVCMLALDPDAPNGVEIYGNAVLTAQNCSVAANSRDGRAMRTYGDAQGKAAAFGAVGEVTGDGFSPAPETGIAPLDDPYADLRLPPAGACVPDPGKLQKGSFSLSPGVYCGGLDIGSQAQVTLQPGFYLMKDGPFSVTAGGKVVGQGVTIAFTGAKSVLYLQGGAEVSLTSPLSGPWAHIQFFSPSTEPTVEWSIVSGGAQLTYTGAMYLPHHELWIKSPGGEGSALNARSETYAIVVKRVWNQGNSRIDVAYDGANNADMARFRWGARLVR